MAPEAQSTAELRQLGGPSPPENGSSAEDAASHSEPRLTTLVSGIIADAQHLIEQQLTMFRQELRDDLRKTRNAILPLVGGVGVTVVGSVLVLLMFPLLLNWAVPEL